MWQWKLVIAHGGFSQQQKPSPPLVRFVVKASLKETTQTTCPTHSASASSSSSSPTVNKLTPLKTHCCHHHLCVVTINVKVGPLFPVTTTTLFSPFPTTGESTYFHQNHHHPRHSFLRKKYNFTTITKIPITRNRSKRKGVITIIEKRLLRPKIPNYLSIFSIWEKWENIRVSGSSASKAAAQHLSYQQELLICWKTIMALFGMAWLLKMRSEIRASGNKVLLFRRVIFFDES